MLPILVVGGVIGAVVSAIQGASWVSDQIGPSNAASAGGKGTPKSSAEAKVTPFETALAAEAAGQTLPAMQAAMTPAITPSIPNVAVPAVASTAAAASLLPATHGTDYDALARMKAGITAYSHVGQHRAGHQGAAKPERPEAGGSVSPS